MNYLFWFAGVIFASLLQPTGGNVGLNANGKTAVIIGTSRDVGYGLPSPTTQRWPSVFCPIVNAVEDNRAVTGSTLMAQGGSSCGRAVFANSLIPTYNSSTHWKLFFAYGPNDIGINLAGMTAAQFIIEYQSAIDNAVNVKGWPDSCIVLVTPYYVNVAQGYSQYVGLCGVTTSADSARQRAFVNGVIGLAQTNHTALADAYDWSLARPDKDVLLNDYVHQNPKGERILAIEFFATQLYIAQ